MKIKHKIIVIFIILLLAFGTGFFLSYQYQEIIREGEIPEEDAVKEESEEREPADRGITPEEVSYQEDIGSYTLKITGHEAERILSDDYPSKPKISPEGRYVSYIAPAEWEQIGTLYVYDSIEQEEYALVDEKDLPDQHTPKNLWWLDEDHILFVGGFGYGTVSVGGSLYAALLSENEIVEIYPEEERKEVKNIEFEGDKIHINIAEFDESFIDYEVTVETISREDIYQIIEDND